MASTLNLSTKRKAPVDTDSEAEETTRADAIQGKEGKKCIICYKAGTTFPRVSHKCNGAHENDVCGHCWRKYIAVNVMEDGEENIACVQFDTCGAYITHDDLKRIVSTKIVEQ